MPLKCLALSLFVLSCPVCLAAADKAADHVVIISVDGFPAYLLDDPKAPIPNVRRLVREGVAAEGMRVVNPSVTWPNHTSLVTGVRADKHGVLANGILTRHGTGQPVTIEPKHDQAELVHVPTLFDIVHQAGMKTAAINWPCTRNSKSLDDNFPDVPENVEYTTPRLREALQAEGLLGEAKNFIKDTSPAQRDQIWTDATRMVIKQHQPNLTLLHLLNVDASHHLLGPQSLGGYTAIAYADACIGRVLDAIALAGMQPTTAVFVVADHGFMLTPKAIKPNALLRREGFLQAGRGGKIEEARVQVVPEGGMGLLYFSDPGLSAEDQSRVKQLFEQQAGIAQVLEPRQFSQFGLPNPRADAQMADLVLLAKDGFGFSGRADGDEIVVEGEAAGVPKGSHGFDAGHDKMNAVFVAAGAGLRKGVRLGQIDNLDVAPTAAALLGVSMPANDGRVLTDALTQALSNPIAK
jgi:predicted AlkP superfamily pyrophosphatase or phosphodiesterase